MQHEILLPPDDSLPILVVVGGETICLRGITGGVLTSEGIPVLWLLTGDHLYIRIGLRTLDLVLSLLSSTTAIMLKKQLISLRSFKLYPKLMREVTYLNGRPTSVWQKDGLERALGSFVDRVSQGQEVTESI
jgi:hypothetical protein